jgi:hypothetical protein
MNHLLLLWFYGKKSNKVFEEVIIGLPAVSLNTGKASWFVCLYLAI